MEWGPREFAFLTNSQGNTDAFLPGPHFDTHCFREPLGLLDVFCCLLLVIVNSPGVNKRMNEKVVLQSEVLRGRGRPVHVKRTHTK